MMIRTQVGSVTRLIVIAGAGLISACSWFHHRHRPAPAPDPTQLIVTGAPKGSVVFVDGTAIGQPTERNDQPQLLEVAPGTHQVEIHLNDVIVYREQTYVAAGDRRVVTVLSGSSR